jgi:hypothetical protein
MKMLKKLLTEIEMKITLPCTCFQRGHCGVSQGAGSERRTTDGKVPVELSAEIVAVQAGRTPFSTDGMAASLRTIFQPLQDIQREGAMRQARTPPCRICSPLSNRIR